DRIGGLQHEADAPVDIQLLLVGVAVDRYAVDVLHDEPRATVVGHATVDELRDTAVTERGEDLALLPEAGGDVRNAERAVQHFHGDATLEHAVRALAEVDRAHTADTQDALQAIAADRAPRECADRLRLGYRGLGQRRAHERGDRTVLRIRLCALAEQAPERAQQVDIVAARFDEECVPLDGRAIERALEQR